MTSVLELDSNEISDHFDFADNGREDDVNVLISADKVVKVLLCVVTALVITGTAAHFITHKVAPSPEHKLAKLMNRFDINFEPSVPAWYSACALLASGGLLMLTGIAKRHEKDRFWKQWLFMGALFIGLSMDEAARFHEMLHIAIVSQIEVHGIFYFPWVVPAFIFVAAVGIWNIPFLKHIDRRTAKLFLIAAVIYVGGAAGVELIGGPLAEKYGMPSTPHMISEVVEETLEMLGIVAFLYALLDHLARCVKPIRVQVLSNSRPVAR